MTDLDVFHTLLYAMDIHHVLMDRMKKTVVRHNLLLLLDTLCIYVDIENFGVKKLRKAQTSTKLKHTRFFYYGNFTFE